MQLLPTLKRLHITTYNAKLEATNNLIKLIKRNAFGFRNFENFTKKRIFIALNIKKERTKCVLSRSGSIIFVVGKSPMGLMEPILL